MSSEPISGLPESPIDSSDHLVVQRAASNYKCPANGVALNDFSNLVDPETNRQNLGIDVGTGRIAFGYFSGGLIDDATFNYDISTKTLSVNHISSTDALFSGNISAANLTGFNRGDLVTDVVDTINPNNTGIFMTIGSLSDPQKLQLCAATGTTPGVVTETTQTIGGNKTFSGTITASNLSGTNRGDFTTGDVFNAPNSTGIFMTAGSSSTPQKLQLTPADVTNPGVLIPDGVQFLGGSKAIAGAVTASNLSGTNHGDFTTAVVNSFSTSSGLALIPGNINIPAELSLCPADGSNPGVITAGTQSIGGNKTFTGTIAASNLSGTNTGNVTVGNVGVLSNPTGIQITGQLIALQEADATNPGALSAGTQNIGGRKTFSDGIVNQNGTTTVKNAISSPGTGQLFFDTTLGKLCVYTGATWQTITSI